MSQSRVCGDVLARATGHSLEEWVGWEAAGAVLSHPTDQDLEKRVVMRRALSCLAPPCLAP